MLTAAADENLRVLKAATKLLPLDWASKVESASRIFGADRALLLIEAVAGVKLMMLSVAFPFRAFRRGGAGPDGIELPVTGSPNTSGTDELDRARPWRASRRRACGSGLAA